MPFPDDATLAESLRSKTCPACGGEKKAGQTLCRADYNRLTSSQRLALYDELGAGYAEAVDAAMSELKVECPAWPLGSRRGMKGGPHRG